MKISNLDAKLLSFDGEEFRDQATGKAITLRSIIFSALDQDKELKDDEKLDRWELQMRIKSGGDIDKTEMKLIKSRLLKSQWTPWIIGTCTTLLNECGEKSDVAKEPAKHATDNVTETVNAS